MFVLTDIHRNICTKTYIKIKILLRTYYEILSLVFISNNPGKIEVIDIIKQSLIFFFYNMLQIYIGAHMLHTGRIAALFK